MMTLEDRRDFIARAESDPVFRAAFLRLIDDPDEGDVFFINTCCWTYDPRNGPDDEPIGDVPFLLWEAQEKAVRKIGKAMDKGHHLGIEKSRDQGVTWMVLACIVRRFLRQRRFSALIGSMTEALVDDQKNPDSLGWRIDLLLENLPAFLVPKGMTRKNDRSWANWQNPEMGSFINGKAPTIKFAVGGRRSVIYYDDFAQWEHGAAAWSLAKASTNCRMASWTVNPEDPMNHAYEIRFAKGRFTGTRTPIIPVSELHWSADPRKQETARDEVTGELYNVWKRQTLEDIPEEQFLRDYEGVYELQSKGRIYSAQIAYVKTGTYPYDPRFPLYTFWDFGVSDDTIILWAQKDWEAMRWRIIDMVVRAGQDTAFYVPFVRGRVKGEVLEYEAEYTENDFAIIDRHTAWQRMVREGGEKVLRVKYEAHYGDPAGHARAGSSNRSAIKVLGEQGITVEVKHDNKSKGFEGRINSARWLLRHVDIDDTYCGHLITALQNYKWNSSGLAPEHDEHCLAGETQIRTLQGWRSIESLVGRDDVYVWAYSHTARRLVPAKAEKIWKTAEGARTIEVRLDDGHKIRCTPNHRFMLRNGEYREAQHLSPGDSLMPFYERNMNGYKRVDLNDGSEAVEHRYVFNLFNGTQESGFHIHHKDDDKQNNNPDNLELISQADHCRITLRNRYTDKEAMSEASKIAARGRQRQIKPCAYCGIPYDGDYKSIYCGKVCKKKKEAEAAKIKKQSNFIESICVTCGKAFIGSARRKSCSEECRALFKKEYERTYDKARRGTGKKRENQGIRNHKVLSVSESEPCDVFDIYVPEFNNFAAEGVMVHNSHPCAALEYGAVNIEEAFKAELHQKREARARGQVQRPGGVFGYAGQYLQQTLQNSRPDEDDEDRYGARRVYNGASRVTGY